MDHLSTYIAHVVIRGIIYRVIFHMPPMLLVVVGLIACYLVVRSTMGKRRKAKVKK